jgi:hypothetical protein
MSRISRVSGQLPAYLAIPDWLQRLEETATHGNQLERRIWLIFSHILALLPWQQVLRFVAPKVRIFYDE